MSYVTAVRADSVALDLARVIADLETFHGRVGVYDGPTASTARLTIIGATSADARTLIVGTELELDGPAGRPLFRGHVTDSSIVDADPDDPAELRLVAIGKLARLGGVPVGLVDYPAEPWAARVRRVLLEAGLYPGLNITLPYQAETWDATAPTTDGFTDGPPAYTFWNLPTGAAIWNYMATLTTHKLVKGRRYHVSSPQIGGHPNNFLVAWAAAGDNATVWLPASAVGAWAPFAWDFVSLNDSDPAGARLIFYLQSVPTADHYLAIQPITITSPADFRIVAPVDDLDLAPRLALDAGPADALTMLTELASIGGAAVYDDPAGTIVVQSLEARPVGSALTIPPALVAWAPPWEQHVDVVNRVTVPYVTGGVAGAVTVEDPASIDRYGLAATDLGGDGFASNADAGRRARTVLVRRAWSRWATDQLELVGTAETLEVGALVNLSLLPASAPNGSATAILESVTLRVAGAAAAMALTLSDPVDSGAALPWNQVPAGFTWAEAQGRWVDALTLESIGAA